MLDHQWHLATEDGDVDFLFGTADTGVQTTHAPDLGQRDVRSVDTSLVREDGEGFGADYELGTTITFEANVLTEGWEENSDLLNAFRSAWSDRRFRSDPDAYAVLKVQNAGRVRRCYGRPRRFAESDGDLSHEGYTGVVADFKTRDGKFYADEISATTIPIVPPTAFGFITPIVVSGVDPNTVAFQTELLAAPEVPTETDPILFSEDFSGVPLGTQPDATNTAYEDTIGDAGDGDGTVTVTAVADDLFGGVCAEFACEAPVGGSFGFLGTPVTPPADGIMVLERYYKVDAHPGFRTSVLLYKDTLLAGTHLGSFAIGGSGQANKFVLVDVDTNSTTSTAVVPIDEWFRVRVTLDTNAHTQTAELFLAGNVFGAIPDESFSAPLGTASLGYVEDGIVTDPNMPLHVKVSHPRNFQTVYPAPPVVTQQPGNVNIGGAETWPWVEIHGPVTSPRVTLGDITIALDYTIPEGMSVVIDPRPWSRKVERSDGANLAGKLTWETPPMGEMLLKPGSYELLYRGNDATGTSYVVVSWREAFHRP